MTTITIYGIKNCSTMKKAFTKLDEMGKTYQFFDYKKQPIDKENLIYWIEKLGIETVLNKKGTTWRNLTEEKKQQANANLADAIALMMAYPSMIKRPIIVKDSHVIAGFDEEKFELLLT